jgi:hypothetical protein
MFHARQQKLPIALVLAVVLLFSAPATANAVATGSVTATINNIPGNANFSVSANTVGWAQGTIYLELQLYVSASKTGPWDLINSEERTCNNATSCSIPGGLYGTISGVCPEGAWYKAKATASGPFGNAENNPSVVKKYIYGSLTGSPISGATTVGSTSTAVAQDCQVIYVGV